MTTNTEVLLNAPQIQENADTAQASVLAEMMQTGKRLIGRTALALGLAAASGTVIGTTEALLDNRPSPAFAATDFTNDYPHPDAPCYPSGAVTGPCANYDWRVPTKDANGNIIGWPEWTSRGFGARNCTDGVAYWVKKYTLTTIPSGWGNAKQWAVKANGIYTVKGGGAHTVEPGDIAQSEDGTFGHVGLVTGVTKQGSTVIEIKVAELNKAGTGLFSHDLYAARNAAGKFTRYGSQDWDYFIDVNGANKGLGNEDIIAPPPPTPPPNNLLVRQGATLLGKAGLTDTWLTLATNATDMQAAGQRVAARDTAGNLIAKNGLGGTWLPESGPVDQYVLTPNLLAIRQGGAIYAKAELHDAWTTVTPSGAVDLQAAGGRIAYKDSSGTVWGRDGVLNVSVAETSNVAEYDVTPHLFLVRQGTTLLGKAHLYDQWTTLTTAATNVQAAGTRIVITDTSGGVQAKEGLGGTWYVEASSASQYVVTPNLLLVRQATTLIGKAALADQWVTVGAGVADVKASGNRIVILDTTGAIVAKDTLGGLWVTEANSATQYAVAKIE